MLGVLAAGLSVVVVRSGVVDQTPPELTLTVPDHVVRDALPVSLVARDARPGIEHVTVQVDDGPLLEAVLDADGHASLQLPVPSTDGRHVVRVRAIDTAWQPNESTREATVRSDRTPPSLTVAVVPAKPSQGEVAALFVRASEPLHTPSFSGLEQARPLREVDEGTWRVLIGLGVDTPTGPQHVVVDARDAVGNATRCTVSIDVQATAFPRGGTIRLSKRQVAARRDTEALAKMKADRTAAYTHIGPAALWEGAALRPVSGRRTSAFGRYRTYSDGRKKHHLGTDLANITGTPVGAALAGEVRASGWQHLFGNAVIVHHGHGLTTSYNHLSKRTVSVGDRVSRGDIVGALGSTGQSTGPHLHWGMQVGEVEVDPERWPDHGFQLAPLAADLGWSEATGCVRVE